MRILVISASYDPHADALSEKLCARNVEVERFNIDQLPHQKWANLRISNDSVEITLPDVDTNVDAVYYRRLAMIRGHGLWRHIPESTRQFAVAEAEATLFGICHSLTDRPWVNHFAGLETHVNKPAGLMIARDVGMSIPDTVITNDPDVVEEFFEKHDGNIIFKAASMNAVHMTEAYSALFYTSRVKREHLLRRDLISALPGIYQAEVKRKDELRITVIDGVLFVARVIPANPNQVDWRRGMGAGLRFEQAVLPDDFARMIFDFMDKAGLRYGAIDVIVTPDGEYVFLEVNPQGAYLWLERELGLPITEAIASALIGTL